MANQPTKYSKFLVGAASAALVASAVAPVASAADFSDTKGNTHEEAINALADAGVISGYPDGSFQPNKTLTRSDVVKLLGKWLVSEGFEIPADAVSNPRFTDLKSTSNKELLEYAAVVKDNGVFNGSNGRLLAADNITRENMAVVIVRAFDSVNGIDLVSYVDAQDFSKDVKDLNSAKSEAQGAINVLDFFDITNPAVANFNPKGSTTRGHFATFLHKSINTDFSKVTGVASAAVSSIKAVNATTVEVTYKEEVSNIGTYTVEGLTVSNAAVKQTDAKTVVLTTTVQEGGKKYEVKENGQAIGSFEGISAVVPTSIKLNVANTQAKVGNQVTLSADIGVKAAGVPVTFNVDAPTGSLNKDQIFEVYTDAEGIASFSYTQYSPDADDITAYPTGAPQLRAFGTVYWGITDILTIVEEDKIGNVLGNGAKKTYTVAYKDPKTGAALANRVLNVSFVENTNVAYNAISNATVTNPKTGVTITPYQTTTNLVQEIEITTDSEGKATFIVSGTNTNVTPYVFVDGSSAVIGTQTVIGTNGIIQNTNANNKWEATELTSTAAKLVFEGAQLTHKTTVERLGEEEAAAKYGDKINGRDYKVTIVDKDGKPYANGLVNVALDEVIDKNLSTKSDAKFLAKDNVVTLRAGSNGQQATIKLDSKGVAEFTLYGDKGTAGTPVVWIDQNTAENNQSGVLEDGEPFFKATSTNFQYERVIGSLFTVEGETKDQNVSFDGIADYAFALTNQSGKALDNLRGKLTYEIRNTSGQPIVVKMPINYTTQDNKTNTEFRIEEYGTITVTAIVSNKADAKFTVQTVDSAKAGSVVVTPAFTTEDKFDASNDNGIATDARDFNKYVTATGLKASFAVIPVNFTGEVVAVDKVAKVVTLAFAGKHYEISYKDAQYYYKTSQVQSTLEYFERQLSVGDVVTFTKGDDDKIKNKFDIIVDNGETARATLANAIVDANKLVANATAGTAPGQYPAQAILDYKAAVAKANLVALNSDSTDAQLNAAKVELDAATVAFEATKVADTVAVAKAALEAAVTAAKAELAKAEAGSAPGQYPAAAITAYDEAIKDAEAVAEKTDATEAELKAAKVVLDAAKAVFAQAKNPEAPVVGDITFTSQTGVQNKVIAQAASYDIAGTVAKEVGDVASVVVAFGTVNLKEVPATYNVATGAFEFKGNGSYQETVIVIAKDASGKELARETLTIDFK